MPLPVMLMEHLGFNSIIFAVYIDSYVMIALICMGHAGTVSTGLTGLNIVPIKYSSDIHTPKHNYDVINIADVTVTV